MTNATLIERVVCAFRSTDPHGRFRDEPAWHDLDEAGRLEAFDATVISRAQEAALHPQALSTTAEAILTKLGR